ncbi:MAG: hypothetical protein ABWZ42_07450 [Ilumatobacteraceae bacterium]
MTTSDLPTGTPAGHREIDEVQEPPREPNYLLRRAIVIGSVVALIAAIAIGVGTLLERDSDSAPSAGAPAEWDTVVLLDNRSGQVILADASGAESARFTSGVRAATDAMTVGSTLVVTSAAAAGVVDLGSETSQVFDLATAPDGVVMPAGSPATLLVGSGAGDRAVLVHGPSGDLIDTEASVPIAGAAYDVVTAVASPSGRDVLLTDSGNFQSVLFSFDREQPSYFPGRALAVDDSLVVTTQNVGTESTLSVFDHDGETVSDARTASVRAGMIAGGHVILVTLDGDVLDLDTSSGETSAGGSTAIGPVRSATVTPTGDRLVVVGDGGTAIIDVDGQVLAELPGTAPIGTGINEFATRTSACLVVVDQLDSGLTVVSLADGSIVAEADRPAGVDAAGGPTAAAGDVLASADGCTAATTAADGVTLVAADGVRTIAGSTDLRSLSPDAAAIVVASDARLQLQAVASDDPPDVAEPIDLGPDSRLPLFTDR